jgi:hypothetical protein
MTALERLKAGANGTHETPKPGANGVRAVALDDYRPPEPPVDVVRTPQNPEGDRVEIKLTPNLHEDAGQIIDALAAQDPGLFQRCGKLVYVDRGVEPPAFLSRTDESATVRIVNDDHLAARVSRVCKFVQGQKIREEFVKIQKPPPERLVRMVRSIPCPGIRPLIGIVTAPTLRPDGSLITSAGYDPSTGLFFEKPGCPEVTVPEWPTRAEVSEAVETLFYPFCDFPFAEDCHRSAAVAAVLTLAARYTFSGCVPLFLVDANRAGTGKGLLVDIAIVIITGTHPASMANTIDDVEMRKRLISLALSADQVVKIDNVGEHEHLGTPSLDSALTAGVIGDRLLGKNETAKLPILATWFATGNNVRLARDMPRRVCHIRLETPLENPEVRPDVRERRLLEYVRKERGKYLSAALTILRGCFAAGRPKRDLPTWGSFEGWSDVIRQCVVWAGLPDPYDTRKQLLAQSDPMAGVFRALVLNWKYLDPDGRGGDGISVCQSSRAI